MKILVTGYAGFVGSYLCNLLNSKKIYYDCYDLTDGNDIRDKMKLDKTFEAGQYDMVIHLAALAGVRRSENFPEEYLSTNIIGTRNIVEMCKKYNVKLINFSSSSVLGGNKTEEGLNEQCEPNPQSIYAMTKYCAEKIVETGGIEYVTIRPFTIYGLNGRPDMGIYKWINQINSGKDITFYGDGKTERGYTNVHDLVEAVYSLTSPEVWDNCKNEIYHIGGNEVITLNELLDMFESVLVKKKKKATVAYYALPACDVVSSFADTSKAFLILGYAPEDNFEKNIKKILDKEL